MLTYAHRHGRQNGLPVYMFYKARSGQLNNQLVSFFNALVIAKEANAILVAPFTYYGSESRLDFARGRGTLFKLHERLSNCIYRNFFKRLGISGKQDELVGDYFDGEILNKAQPVVSMTTFLQSRGAEYLRSFPDVHTRKGDAGFYYSSLGKRRLLEKNVNIRGTYIGKDESITGVRIPSRRELDCNFKAADYFRGLPFHAGVNGNYLFFGLLYRSHSLNCTAQNPYWLDVRRYVQPRREIREIVAEHNHRWGRVMALHLRLFPFDIGKFDTETFCVNFVNRFDKELQDADHVYIAYSMSSQVSQKIVDQLRLILGKSKILTAADYGDLEARSPAFFKRYALPIVDMWTCVTSRFFVGRLGSSFSWNVVFWREAFQTQGAQRYHDFYALQEFSNGNAKNPTDSYIF